MSFRGITSISYMKMFGTIPTTSTIRIISNKKECFLKIAMYYCKKLQQLTHHLECLCKTHLSMKIVKCSKYVLFLILPLSRGAFNKYDGCWSFISHMHFSNGWLPIMPSYDYECMILMLMMIHMLGQWKVIMANTVLRSGSKYHERKWFRMEADWLERRDLMG